MESPSMWMARKADQCSTERCFPGSCPWPYEDSEIDASTTAATSAIRKRCKQDGACFITNLLSNSYKSNLSDNTDGTHKGQPHSRGEILDSSCIRSQ